VADEQRGSTPTIGWIGTGRMGSVMAERLLGAGYRLAVYNRTRTKAEPLAKLGASLVDSPVDLASCSTVFTMVSASDAFLEVVLGPNGLLTGEVRGLDCIVDCSTISSEASAKVREAAMAKGVALVDAPVSGNAKVAAAGKLAIVASGDHASFESVRPYLNAVTPAVTYVGEGEAARTVKICHNLLLAVVAQSLAEITVLAEKSGVPRHALIDFINNSVMGSMFTRYKAPAYVGLDFTPTFTPALLRKDLDLGLAIARQLEVPLPLVAQTREIVQSLIGNGYVDCDFAALLELQARAANLKLEPEDVQVGTGL